MRREENFAFYSYAKNPGMAMPECEKKYFGALASKGEGLTVKVTVSKSHTISLKNR